MSSLLHGCLPRPPRFTQLPDSLIDALSPREHQVIHLLLSYRWTDDSPIYPSVKTMARRLRCSDRTVQRTIRSLEARGYLVVEAQHRADLGQQSNLYRPGPQLAPLLPPAGGDGVARLSDDRRPPVTRAAGEQYSGKRYTPTTTRERLYSRIPQAASAYLETRTGTLSRR